MRLASAEPRGPPSRAAARGMGARPTGPSCPAGPSDRSGRRLACPAAQLHARRAGMASRPASRPAARGFGEATSDADPPGLAAGTPAALPHRDCRGPGERAGHRLLRAVGGGLARAPRRLRPIPLYAPPPDLATHDPYWSRTQIDTSAAARKALRGHEIAWLRDPLDALVLHIQGSGRIAFAASPGRPAETVRLAFAAHNGQPYRSVGRWLIEQGELRPEQASWPAIRAWAQAAPGRGSTRCCTPTPATSSSAKSRCPTPKSRPERRAGRGTDPRPLDRRRSAERALRHPRLARHHGTALDHAAAAPRRSPRTPAPPSPAPSAPTTSGAGAKKPRRRPAA